jgi:hypothetical protein
VERVDVALCSGCVWTSGIHGGREQGRREVASARQRDVEEREGWSFKVVTLRIHRFSLLSHLRTVDVME